MKTLEPSGMSLLLCVKHTCKTLIIGLTRFLSKKNQFQSKVLYFHNLLRLIILPRVVSVDHIIRVLIIKNVVP